MTGYTRQSSAGIQDGSTITADLFNTEYDLLQTAFNTSTGHKHDGSSAEGPPITVIGPTQDVVATGTVLRPKTDNTVDLGTSTLEYKDLFVDGTANIDTLQVDENATVTGNLTVNGNTTIGNSSGDSFTLTANVSSHVIPSTNNTYDLGSVSRLWRNLYVNGVAILQQVDINSGIISDVNIIDADISGGEISSLGSPIGVADGGTGATDLEGVRINLNLGAVTIHAFLNTISSNVLQLVTNETNISTIPVGARFSFRASLTTAINTATTVKIDSATAIPLKTVSGSDIPENYFIEDALHTMWFDGTNMICDRPVEVSTSGSNYCCRYANGLQICTTTSSNTDGVTTASGSLFMSSSNYTWTFLNSFVNNNYSFSGTMTNTAGVRINGIIGRGVSVGSVDYRFWTSTSLASSETVTARLQATGRWY
jgi:hypothetical protein